MTFGDIVDQFSFGFGIWIGWTIKFCIYAVCIPLMVLLGLYMFVATVTVMIGALMLLMNVMTIINSWFNMIF